MKFIIITNTETNTETNATDMLSKSGFENAENLKKILNITPDIVFSSPYISTLQTIYPFCFTNNIEVNIDYALYPCKHMDITYSETKYLEFYPYLYDIVNLNYKGVCLNNNIAKIERDIDIKNRLYPFLYDLSNTLDKTNKTVLIVTHPCIKKLILEYFNKDETVNKCNHNITTFNIETKLELSGSIS